MRFKIRTGTLENSRGYTEDTYELSVRGDHWWSQWRYLGHRRSLSNAVAMMETHRKSGRIIYEEK